MPSYRPVTEATVPELKVAVTLLAWLKLTVQVVAVPEQSPLQPVNVLPVVAVAVSVTLVPLM
jgi:hypothetical protein